MGCGMGMGMGTLGERTSMGIEEVKPPRAN